ncbi:MAG: SH3 domain-containing protein [Anaerolineae bacterium]
MLNDLPVGKWLVIALLLGFITSVSAAQPGLSAQLDVLHAGVEIRAHDSVNWLAVRPGAQMAFGPGDSLRTSHTGRAYLTFADSLEILVMPDSTFSLATFIDQPQPTFTAQVEGHLIQRRLSALEVADYQLTVGHLTLTHPADFFAVWSAFEGYDVVTVDQGRVDYSAAGIMGVVGAAQGMLLAEGESFLTAPDYPLNAARMVGARSTCVGQIENGGEANLNVRAAPGVGSSIIGNIADQSRVPIMGINARRTWYRIQVLTGFGWVRAALVKNDCANPPLLPDESLENNVEMFDVSPLELALLQPFYGQPENNLWFYRSFAGA